MIAAELVGRSFVVGAHSSVLAMRCVRSQVLRLVTTQQRVWQTMQTIDTSPRNGVSSKTGICSPFALLQVPRIMCKVQWSTGGNNLFN